ncbi:hypothetical protein [Bosea sp. MMO-172]|uniref:hypothetical protein n=1 Tax=Bosea sp. MMO-172 TaxID=3127885 RepID=UPI003016C616
MTTNAIRQLVELRPTTAQLAEAADLRDVDLLCGVTVSAQPEGFSGLIKDHFWNSCPIAHQTLGVSDVSCSRRERGVRGVDLGSCFLNQTYEDEVLFKVFREPLTQYLDRGVAPLDCGGVAPLCLLLRFDRPCLIKLSDKSFASCGKVRNFLAEIGDLPSQLRCCRFVFDQDINASCRKRFMLPRLIGDAPIDFRDGALNLG